MNFYSVFGLSVGSDIPLPGMAISARTDNGPDVTVCRGVVPPALDNAQAKGAIWQMAGMTFLMVIPGIARFLLSDGRLIVVEPEPGADAAEVAVFLIGTVLGILLHQRGQIVLQASAVRVNGKAVLFCGPSGAGKSTLAAALTQRGYAVLADDVCAVTRASDGSASIHSDGRVLKLWAHAIDGLKLADRRGERLRAKLEKYYVEPHASAHGPLPLGAVYALRETRPPRTTGIERPNVVDAALILRRAAYRPLLVRLMKQKALYFSAATLADTVGIFHLTRPFNLAAMPDTLDVLEQHWCETGIMEMAA